MREADIRNLAALRANIRALQLTPRQELIQKIADSAELSFKDRESIVEAATQTIRHVRSLPSRNQIENLLAGYQLSSKEGVALMCLAEALPRIPDTETANAFIRDKIVPSDWSRHLKRSSSVLVNASSWALSVSGRALNNGDKSDDMFSTIQGMTRKMGESVMQSAVEKTVKALGEQFVLAENIDDALKRSTEMKSRGYVYSYDMLGEAAHTQADADDHYLAYSNAVTTLIRRGENSLHENSDISVKLSTLHPRYYNSHREKAVDDLKARCLSLALLAKSAQMGFHLDGEESERLDLSLDVIEAVMSESSLMGWDGFGIVVQAYSQRAPAIIDWAHTLAERLNRRIMVRLVKGAYWDREIKRAQVLGLDGFPVYTHKSDTDIAYISCARKLLKMRDRIYPQFATHNAHTIHAILHMAGNVEGFEFQRLHGMGMALHEHVRKTFGNRCRIYAPVGEYVHLLSFLARRLLENGANNFFMNRLVDSSVAPEEVVADPFEASLDAKKSNLHPVIAHPRDLFAPTRTNSRGWDWQDAATVEQLDKARAPYKEHQWQCRAMIKEAEDKEESKPAGPQKQQKQQIKEIPINNPAFPKKVVGQAVPATPADAEQALKAAREEWTSWRERSMEERAGILEAAADLYEKQAPELFELLIQESGKTVPDAIGEVRDAVDFLRFYAEQSRLLPPNHKPLGVFVCISPWNFPLAFFTGQIAAALVVGNVVVAKPSERTPLIAARATSLLHKAGIPVGALQLLPDSNGEIGALLVKDKRVDGVCFTGSTSTAQGISRSMAEFLSPQAPLIAETGAVNAMIVDSTALTEQATCDILASAFQSAGQRCSALRVLYVQRECEEQILKMLFGAMDELQIGDPGELSTDVGPMIDAKSRDAILAYIEQSDKQAKCLKRCEVPEDGNFAPPCVMGVCGIEEVKREIIGPVLHIATFKAAETNSVLNEINDHGYGLTFGLHSRISKKADNLVELLHVGNMYVNRNQLGAVVGSQPFGGEGLSGTGPKAGGPNYLPRFCFVEETTRRAPRRSKQALSVEKEKIRQALRQLATLKWKKGVDNSAVLARALKASRLPMSLPVFDVGPFDLPGPTGENNRLLYVPRGIALCLGLEEEDAFAQALSALAVGGSALVITPESNKAKAWFEGIDAPILFLQGMLPPDSLEMLQGFDVVCCRGNADELRPYARALAQRRGKIIQLTTNAGDLFRFIHERHLCIDTTATGGNSSPLSATAEAA